jgi:hypothetical protein
MSTNAIWFSANVRETSIDQAMDLPGYSHCGEQIQRTVSWYPFTETRRTVFFKARNLTEARRQIVRLQCDARDVARCAPEDPVLYVRRKAAIAKHVAMLETSAGDFSRFGKCVRVSRIGGGCR